MYYCYRPPTRLVADYNFILLSALFQQEYPYKYHQRILKRLVFGNMQITRTIFPKLGIIYSSKLWPFLTSIAIKALDV